MRKTKTDELGRLTPEEFALTRKMPVTVVLDGVRSMNNVGSFFRTCDAFAVERILLCGITGTPPNREIHKTALGAENTVSWEYHKNTVAALTELRQEGYNIQAVEQVDGSCSLSEFQPEANQRYALIFGNEVFGVSDSAIGVCDGAIEIPQAGTKHSLNVSVSAGVVLWHFFSKLLPDQK